MSHNCTVGSFEACSVQRLKRMELSKYCQCELNNNGDARQNQS